MHVNDEKGKGRGRGEGGLVIQLANMEVGGLITSSRSWHFVRKKGGRLLTLSVFEAHTHRMVYQSINQSINSIRVHHATKALGHNMVQNSTMTT